MRTINNIKSLIQIKIKGIVLQFKNLQQVPKISEFFYFHFGSIWLIFNIKLN